MLGRSSSSTDREHLDLVKSTAAVIFLGTPHRGSPDLASLGEYVRSLVSSLRMETNSAVLDALGLKTSDLERAQESFSALWQKHSFRVKTFQEGLGMSGLNLGVFGNKVVPDHSSLIGDAHERAETLQANHKEMCCFSGGNDPNYRKVAGEIRSLYASMIELNAMNPPGRQLDAVPETSSITNRQKGPFINRIEHSLQSLLFPTMDSRQQQLESPAHDTCSWLFEHQLYQNWWHELDVDKHYGLLWIKGKPGAGKSVLMREMLRRASEANSDYWVASFFFNAKGEDMEHSWLGSLRSLLYQILSQNRKGLNEFARRWDKKARLQSGDQDPLMFWVEEELKSFFRIMCEHHLSTRTIIFIDALDECDPSSVRSQAYFWRQMTIISRDAGASLSVCLSSRHFPSITLSNCPEIMVQDHNTRDITNYVNQKFGLAGITSHAYWTSTRDIILQKSAGVFLWVVLVVDDVLPSWDDGENLDSVRYRILQEVPRELEKLFWGMLRLIEPELR